jgi:hypothetical protein
MGSSAGALRGARPGSFDAIFEQPIRGND